MELKPSNRVRMSQDGDKAVLLIKDVYEDDAGDITCELSNKKGKESSTAKLKVQSRYTGQTTKTTEKTMNKITNKITREKLTNQTMLVQFLLTLTNFTPPSWTLNL